MKQVGQYAQKSGNMNQPHGTTKKIQKRRITSDNRQKSKNGVAAIHIEEFWNTMGGVDRRPEHVEHVQKRIMSRITKSCASCFRDFVAKAATRGGKPGATPSVKGALETSRLRRISSARRSMARFTAMRAASGLTSELRGDFLEAQAQPTLRKTASCS